MSIPTQPRILGWFSALLGLVMAGIVAHRIITHATPERALLADHAPFTGIVQSLPFAQGRLIISEQPHGNGFYGWYLTHNFWGWHDVTTSVVSTGLTPSEAPINWTIIPAKGQAMLWGVIERPMKTVIFRQDQQTFSCSVGPAGLWHLQLPHDVSVIGNNQWFMRLRNGKIVPMYS
ncbi:hypothetical protein [Sulfobacillus thermosulfidooxidans]|uniref:hypothetical protein n=1 Tax=Sulfobacillus thermosulfidooxidans TaxID=28034 RepID=UPI000A97F0B1|nr:hypothetical protein [Sulfobacillus thermosulfidooxidans]